MVKVARLRRRSARHPSPTPVILPRKECLSSVFERTGLPFSALTGRGGPGQGPTRHTPLLCWPDHERLAGTRKLKSQHAGANDDRTANSLDGSRIAGGAVTFLGLWAVDGTAHLHTTWTNDTLGLGMTLPNTGSWVAHRIPNSSDDSLRHPASRSRRG